VTGAWAVSAGRVFDGQDVHAQPHGALPHATRDLARGLDPLASLQVLTSRAADAIGLGGRKGVLAPGADADLLAVRGDPTRDPGALLDVIGVWAGGTRVR
jgi:imidazolonepropionase-like amidohydrolase